MNNATSALPTDWTEARRLRAWELVRKGWKQQDVAAVLGCPGPRYQWVSKALQEGVSALRSKFAAAAKQLLAHPQVLRACVR